MRRAAWLLVALCATASAEERSGTHELLGHMGSRAALLTLNASRNPDASWRLAGEYVVLATRQRRFLEGEASPEIGVTTLREGDTPILFGRPGTGELRGVWRGGAFRGSRFATGGQEREQFAFSEEFPSLGDYTGAVRCEVHDGRYQASLRYDVQAGRVQSFEWRSRLGPDRAWCRLASLVQQPMQGGIGLAAGSCRVTLRDLGEAVRVAAESCTEQCGGQGQPEPMLVDRRGACQLFGAQAR